MIGFWLFNIALALLVSKAVTAITLRLVRGNSSHKKPADKTRVVSSHSGACILLVGIILLPVVILSMMAVLRFDSFFDVAPTIKALIAGSGIDFYFLVCAFFVIYLLGICSDFSRVRKPVLR